MKLSYLKPKLFSVIKSYDKGQAVKDLVAGVIVAIIALPVVLDIVFCVGNLVLNIVIFGAMVVGAIYGFNYLKEKIMG